MPCNLLLSQVESLIEKKHEHLLAAVQRYFVVRHFCLHMLKEMRLSKLKALSQTDYRAVLMEDPTKSLPCVSLILKVECIFLFLHSFKHLMQNTVYPRPRSNNRRSKQIEHRC